VALAVRAALALDCTVHERSIWARKNYFYPDLPKGYQITQFEQPMATDGVVASRCRGSGRCASAAPTWRRTRASRCTTVSGRHCGGPQPAGTPLVEIVTEPDLGSPADVRAFLVTLKRILEYVDVSDCNMEEGSLRVDANVSVRRRATGSSAPRPRSRT
jgi:aspartyl-tRNA(Asn)/glutamyl-tRNA(Gln) amidotransferase subunit B